MKMDSSSKAMKEDLEETIEETPLLRRLQTISREF